MRGEPSLEDITLAVSLAAEIIFAVRDTVIEKLSDFFTVLNMDSSNCAWLYLIINCTTYNDKNNLITA